MTTFFRNIRFFRLPDAWEMTAEQLGAALAQRPLTTCGGMDAVARGWLPNRTEADFLFESGGHWLVTLGVEEKILPSATIKRLTAQRAAKIEAEQDRKVGRKELRDLRERITEELLPKALTRFRTTRCWIDPKGRWLAIEAGSDARSDEFLEMLQNTLEGIALRPLQTTHSPVSAMTDWLVSGDAPSGFTIDQDAELRSCADGKSAIRYVHHGLEGDDIRAHLAAGKTVANMGMTWNDRISFVLTDKLRLKRITFLDIIKEEAEQMAETAEEQFGVDFTIMTGEFARLLGDLTLALGGELKADEAAA